jgi:hypothetical protein
MKLRNHLDQLWSKMHDAAIVNNISFMVSTDTLRHFSALAATHSAPIRTEKFRHVGCSHAYNYEIPNNRVYLDCSRLDSNLYLGAH